MSVNLCGLERGLGRARGRSHGAQQRRGRGVAYVETTLIVLYSTWRSTSAWRHNGEVRGRGRVPGG